MFFRVIENLLPKQVFNRLLAVVEGEDIDWHWARSKRYVNRNETDSNFMLGKVLFQPFKNETLSHGGDYIDKQYAELFCIITDYQLTIHPFSSVVRMKLNLYPNQGKNIKHVKHADITTEKEEIDDKFMTSIFNFHTCNGSTVIELGDKIEEVKSKANQLIVFDNAWHYGITQSDTPRRIVLNTNVLKSSFIKPLS